MGVVLAELFSYWDKLELGQKLETSLSDPGTIQEAVFGFSTASEEPFAMDCDTCGLVRALSLEPPSLKRMKQVAQQSGSSVGFEEASGSRGPSVTARYRAARPELRSPPRDAAGLRAVAGGLNLIEKIGHELKRIAQVLGSGPAPVPIPPPKPAAPVLRQGIWEPIASQTSRPDVRGPDQVYTWPEPVAHQAAPPAPPTMFAPAPPWVEEPEARPGQIRRSKSARGRSSAAPVWRPQLEGSRGAHSGAGSLSASGSSPGISSPLGSQFSGNFSQEDGLRGQPMASVSKRSMSARALRGAGPVSRGAETPIGSQDEKPSRAAATPKFLWQPSPADPLDDIILQEAVDLDTESRPRAGQIQVQPRRRQNQPQAFADALAAAQEDGRSPSEVRAHAESRRQATREATSPRRKARTPEPPWAEVDSPQASPVEVLRALKGPGRGPMSPIHAFPNVEDITAQGPQEVSRANERPVPSTPGPLPKNLDKDRADSRRSSRSEPLEFKSELMNISSQASAASLGADASETLEDGSQATSERSRRRRRRREDSEPGSGVSVSERRRRRDREEDDTSRSERSERSRRRRRRRDEEDASSQATSELSRRDEDRESRGSRRRRRREEEAEGESQRLSRIQEESGSPDSKARSARPASPPEAARQAQSGDGESEESRKLLKDYLSRPEVKAAAEAMSRSKSCSTVGPSSPGKSSSPTSSRLTIVQPVEMSQLKRKFEELITDLEDLEKQQDAVQQDRERLEKEKQQMTSGHCSNADIVQLNVGGHLFTTKRRTLLMAPEGSLLHSMFCGRWEDSLPRDEQTRIFLDFTPMLFETVLSYLRTRRWLRQGCPLVCHLLKQSIGKSFI
ncbi:unnamed protein product [Effrenium voratum]|nr:unnamed protein product [Effrenium voratum]